MSVQEQGMVVLCLHTKFCRHGKCLLVASGGPRTDWNEALISQVICPAYKRLIESCKEKSFPSLDGITSHMKTEMVEGK